MLRQGRIDLDEVRELATLARKAAKGRDVLYHGTRYGRSILSMGMMAHSYCSRAVAFTRSAETAAYWAKLSRDDDEGQGAILIFDRQSLRARYKIELHHDDIWDDDEYRNDEMEERICRHVTDVGVHLLGF